MIRTDRWLHANAETLGIEPEYVNPASVDVCLGPEIIEYRTGWFNCLLHTIQITLSGNEPTYSPHLHGRPCQTHGKYIHVGRYDHTLKRGQEFTFKPGRSYLAHTQEITTIPDDHAALLLLKSSSGRKGLGHNSGWGDPGFSGAWTFELTAHRSVTFKCGQRIAQLVFMECRGAPERTYAVTGHYQGQRGVTEAK